MQTDRYTKFILTVIAVALIANAFVTFWKPLEAHAQTGKKWSSIMTGGVEVPSYKKELSLGYEPFGVGGAGTVFFRK
jgi:hypothetical protein